MENHSVTSFVYSLVCPVYNVSPYLDAFFESLERQTIGVELLQIILVDDGSTDDSLVKCQEFASKYPASTLVLSRENLGQAAAKNHGLSHATCEWVCFPDPDDLLDEQYFEAVSRYMQAKAAREAAMFSGHLIPLKEDGRKVDNHSTRFQFDSGNVTVDLVGKPNFVHGNGPTNFFKRSVIEAGEVRFEERLRSRFDDASFVANYILASESTFIALVSDALYFHRKRDDGAPNVPAGFLDRRTYEDVPQFGYLPVLQRARQCLGYVPRWLQWLIVYDIVILFKADFSTKHATRRVAAEALAAYHDALPAVFSFIERETVLGFDMTSLPAWLREALAVAYTSADYQGPVVIGPPDEARGLIQVRYRFTGGQRQEVFLVRGKRVGPRYQKTRTYELLGRVMLKERILWVSSLGVLRFEIDGTMQQLVTKELTSSSYKFRREQILQEHRRLVKAGIPRRFQRVDQPMHRVFQNWVTAKLRNATSRELNEDKLLGTVIRLTWVRRKYLGAWALMDREFEANDSAEVLYRWIRDHKKSVKLFYVLQREAPDWERLKSDGFNMVALGSYRWKILMLLAAHVVSSHATAYITDPLPVRRFGPPQWKFTFLQHGVIKGNLSRWLNKKRIELFVTSTEDEYNYISGESQYKYGPKEVRLTGLPRHDALLAKSKGIEVREVNQILIAPTWRQFLAGRLVGNSTRELRSDFMESEFATRWQSLVNSAELKAIAESNHLRLVFLPHPNLQPYLGEFSVPDWVETKTYGSEDIQELVARSRLMITDFSSQAFNMAYLYRPVIYYQFDAERYNTEHTEEPGYYEYESHGFGPVEVDEREVYTSLRALLKDSEMSQKYRTRAESTFPVRDGRNSERVYKAIVALDKKIPYERSIATAQLDRWTEPEPDVWLPSVGSSVPE